MNPFDLDILVWPIAVIFFTTLLVSFLFTNKPVLSICAAFIKSGIFAIYFGYFFNGTYTFKDDWGYIAGGEKLLIQGVGATNLKDNLEFVLMVGGGRHFIYHLYNTYAFRIFSQGYFAPVALNILLTIVIAYFGTKLAVTEFKMSKQLSYLFFFFLLLHPDILAWSNIMNGKDILVLSLHVMMLISVSMYLRGRLVRAIALGLPVVFVLFSLRFYVPLLFIISLSSSILLTKRRNQIKYLLFSIGLLFIIFLWIKNSHLEHALTELQKNFVNPFYGLIHITLRPIPFNTEANYAFLNYPALIHWALIPFVFLGFIYVLSMKTPFSRFFIAYLVVFFGLYAIYGELQGARHRVQLDYAWATLQFIGIMVAAKTFKKLQYAKLENTAST